MKTDGNNLRKLAERLVQYGRQQGADEIEITLYDGREFEVEVRLGRIENLVEAASRYCTLRVIKEKRVASASSSDLTLSTLQSLIRRAISRALLTHPDDFAGLPAPARFKITEDSLKLYDPEVARLKPQEKIKLALATEKIALKDKRITNSFGASFVTNELKTVLVNSNGFSGEYLQTYCSLSLGLQAGQGDRLVEDYWFSSRRHFKDLASPEEVARTAIDRTVRQLNPRKIKTQNAPVIFEPTMTSWLLAFLFACVSGTAVYQQTTFLAGKLGEKIANDLVTVIDDGLWPGRLGSRPFDSEGLPTQRTVVVEKGVLKNYLCNTYASRKLNLPATGNGNGRGVVPNNFFLEPGPTTPEEIIRSTRKGLLLTRVIGHGLNSVTGDISRGASGLWIEDGRVVYPVSEITIAGNLGQILKNIEAVGNDLQFESPVCGPTIKVAEMTVAGR
ncbi:MAG: TldD/PmbA family protein [Candidatus Saccharicenans sp.]|jgi:PmbA protein|nr:TldD/PmbA family protein [Candidatus Saccharicenans sp.]MDH7492869.1 TldD/PmbA family protein [Candidatus Saccharicenans sp.]